VTTTYGNKPSAERLVMTEILMDNAAALLGEDEEPLMDEREHLVPLLYSIVHKWRRKEKTLKEKWRSSGWIAAQHRRSIYSLWGITVLQ
jgi:hypothetical protein